MVYLWYIEKYHGILEIDYGILRYIMAFYITRYIECIRSQLLDLGSRLRVAPSTVGSVPPSFQNCWWPF